MIQSTLPNKSRSHVAIIMDGNGRWAERRGLPRTAGHRAGMEAVRRTVEAAPDLGIAMLTLFAFSADNWRRPAEEVDALMTLFHAYLQSETAQLVENGVRLGFIGRRDRLAAPLRAEMQRAEHVSASGTRLHVRIAVDYSSRAAIAEAAARCAAGAPAAAEDFDQRLTQALADLPAARQVDLLIRTGGEKRLSDFLLWESAYAELWFTEMMWPDFGAEELRAAMSDFAGRERRFGGLSGAKQNRTENVFAEGENRGVRHQPVVTS